MEITTGLQQFSISSEGDDTDRDSKRREAHISTSSNPESHFSTGADIETASCIHRFKRTVEEHKCIFHRTQQALASATYSLLTSTSGRKPVSANRKPTSRSSTLRKSKSGNVTQTKFKELPSRVRAESVRKLIGLANENTEALTTRNTTILELAKSQLKKYVDVNTEREMSIESSLKAFQECGESLPKAINDCTKAHKQRKKVCAELKLLKSIPEENPVDYLAKIQNQRRMGTASKRALQALASTKGCKSKAVEESTARLKEAEKQKRLTRDEATSLKRKHAELKKEIDINKKKLEVDRGIEDYLRVTKEWSEQSAQEEFEIIELWLSALQDGIRSQHELPS